MTTQQKHWLSGMAKQILAVLAALGITIGGVIGYAATVGRNMAENCIREIAEAQIVTVTERSDARIKKVEDDVECLTYDVKLIRYMLEEMADYTTRKRAMDKMAEPWRVR